MNAIGDTNALLKSLQKETEKNSKALIAPHRKTGHLQRSIVNGPLTRTTAVVIAKANYAASMEFGAKPHRIPKNGTTLLAWPATAAGRRLSGRANAKAMKGGPGLGGRIKRVGLVGPSSGTFRYAMFVNHPGNKPYPFLIPGAKKAVEGLDDLIAAQWNGAA